MALVSVIIPNYNHASYLQQRIDSVLNQTYHDFEVIILDDCSTDNSKEIIDQYRNHEKVNCIVYNETNSGSTFKQWDKGIQLAKGEYIWIAESDDWCENTLLENVMHGLEMNHSCVVGYCQSYCIIGDNRIKFQSGHSNLREYIAGEKFIKEFLLPRNPIFNAGMAVWKKEAYNTMSREFLQYKLVGDYYFWIELCTWGNVFVCGKLLNYFREHEKNVSFSSFHNGSNYAEQVILLKSLLGRNIINNKDYLLALKKIYSLFRFSQEDSKANNIPATNKIFYSDHRIKFQLNLYYFQKFFQLKLRKLLRL